MTSIKLFAFGSGPFIQINRTFFSVINLPNTFRDRHKSISHKKYATARGFVCTDFGQN